MSEVTDSLDKDISNELTSPIEQVLVLSTKTSTTVTPNGEDTKMQERRRRQHTCSYRIRKVTNKGAILVLAFNFLLMGVFYTLTVHSPDLVYTKAGYIMWGVTLPIAGWLADVYFGRYNVIHYSTWIMWVAAALATVSSIAAELVTTYHSAHRIVLNVFLSLVCVGFGGYQANIIQFGIDQLHDASTTEIKSFITWYVWTYLSGGVVIETVFTCTSKEYKILGMLMISACLTIVLCLSFCFSGMLIKEPVTQNPFRLAYKVIQFAIRHKHPIYRSAFTYCEDELPSRIDFGKSKYGGPFTTEQVEDVKTFLRILPVVFLGCTLPGGLLVTNPLRDQFNKLLILKTEVDKSTGECYEKASFTTFPFYIAVLLIPLHEYILNPFLHRYFYWMHSYRKFSIGVALQLARVIILIAYLITARYTYLHDNHGHNATTIQCIFQEDYGALHSSFDVRLMLLPNVLNSVSIMYLGIGGVEFICAQTPYSMRGLISGAGYGSVAIFTLIGYGITHPFTMALPIWSTDIISCGFWYLLLVIVYLAISSIVLSILGRMYKNRKREDVLPNEQIFAERYYGGQ